jgi:hypothetical protein
MFILYKLFITALECASNKITNQIEKCPKDSKVWALLPLIVYTIPFASAFLNINLEQTIFVFILLTIVFYQKVERSLKIIKCEWKIKHIEMWILPFLPGRLLLKVFYIV